MLTDFFWSVYQWRNTRQASIGICALAR